MHLLVGHCEVAILHAPWLISSPSRCIAVIYDGLVEHLLPLLIYILRGVGEEEITDEAFDAFEAKLQELGLNEFLSFWQEVLDQL